MGGREDYGSECRGYEFEWIFREEEVMMRGGSMEHDGGQKEHAGDHYNGAMRPTSRIWGAHLCCSGCCVKVGIGVSVCGGYVVDVRGDIINRSGSFDAVRSPYHGQRVHKLISNEARPSRIGLDTSPTYICSRTPVSEASVDPGAPYASISLALPTTSKSS